MTPPPELEMVTIKLSDGIALLKFNRPKAGNALNRTAFKDMLAALQWATSSPDVRVIVQSGEGKFFTAGMDLMDGVYDDPQTVLPDETIATLDAYHKTLISTDKVLVAAVNGPAVGYGTSSIALFDLVYSVPEAFFFTPFVKWGLCAEACSSFTFAHILGRQKASALILADERMTAAELERAGLITKIIPAENLSQEVMQIAGRIAKLPANALRFNKGLLMRPYRDALLKANEIELAGLKERARTQEAKDAIQAFAQQQESKKKTRAKL
ncbi:hypothetical protein LTR10_019667 [Elasticomyces elasticus]|uniref:Enoyl-CoA hydratase n=1 Tax=Exophiala sideris TaxID=1016849 RepID=A0ABR0IXV4_9EURO|nr:hypothetical protein LTR10_019667 [Elasticomyces elasticus]KAK5022077.1 hypothetical protein LTS07_010326 [Exophiala sideris]KAK5023573.1 hypothetical protein LTR13_011162 [Exophiala sideris]KAK5051213.1 hypothetical protein LTR69_010425 [Exophiala sideris]KAK5176232.1 hypothetical protein LTR44_011203 [Eurotiomycetes sp. CCFEE 6388]